MSKSTITFKNKGYLVIFLIYVEYKPLFLNLFVSALITLLKNFP